MSDTGVHNFVVRLSHCLRASQPHSAPYHTNIQSLVSITKCIALDSVHIDYVACTICVGVSVHLATACMSVKQFTFDFIFPVNQTVKDRAPKNSSRLTPDACTYR